MPTRQGQHVAIGKNFEESRSITAASWRTASTGFGGERYILPQLVCSQIRIRRNEAARPYWRVPASNVEDDMAIQRTTARSCRMRQPTFQRQTMSTAPRCASQATLQRLVQHNKRHPTLYSLTCCATLIPSANRLLLHIASPKR
jgi:hypothetical protein